MKVANPDYVVGKKPPYAMQPPITHPPFCVCAICPGHRQRPSINTRSGRPSGTAKSARSPAPARSARPRNCRSAEWPSGLAKPYTNIRKQWDRLIAIAGDMLGYPRVNEKADFFTFRHTSATNIAQMASNREELMRVVNMMGDTNVETVHRHYTRTPTCIRVSSTFRYTTASHGEHVPFVRLSGRWLEKYGFNIEGHVHIEAEHGRLILTNHRTHMAKVWESLP